jgi:SPP1 family predicted phage head-tail adaptor
MGGTVDVFSTVATIRAGIWPVSVSEQRRAAAPTAVGTHQIRIRYYAGLSAAWRVKFGARYFSIVSVVDKEERHVQMDLLCREVMA